MNMPNLNSLLHRARADFDEMPGLQLTMPQARRLWNIGADDCHSVVSTLVEAGFLRWTASRTVVRTGRPLVLASIPDLQRTHVSV
jgi:hypothetical protein